MEREKHKYMNAVNVFMFMNSGYSGKWALSRPPNKTFPCLTGGNYSPVSRYTYEMIFYFKESFGIKSI